MPSNNNNNNVNVPMKEAHDVRQMKKRDDFLMNGEREACGVLSDGYKDIWYSRDLRVLVTPRSQLPTKEF